MASNNSDVLEFNKYMKLNRDGLMVWGETCNDLMINIFKGCTAAGNETFVQYMA